MSYVQGFVVPVRDAERAAYVAMAAKAASVFREYGAVRVMEAWGEDVPPGKVTDFRRAVAAEAGESVVFAWIEWPDRATCDAASARMRTDSRMAPDGPIPFDMGRMIFGGFVPVLDTAIEGGAG